MGNMFSYIGSDVHGRFRRAQGYDVFELFGFDAFGSHSENFAATRGHQMVRDGYVDESGRALAETEYRDWVAAEVQMQFLDLVAVEGVRTE